MIGEAGEAHRVSEAMDEAILKALRENEGLGPDHPRGLMTKQVAEQTKQPLDTTKIALNDMADRGLVHRSIFFWSTGEDSANE